MTKIFTRIQLIFDILINEKYLNSCAVLKFLKYIGRSIIIQKKTPTRVGVCISPTRMNQCLFVFARILACFARFLYHVGLGWYVGIHPIAHTSVSSCGGAGVWAFNSSSTRQFSCTQRGWCVGINQFAHTTSPLPHPKLPVVICFAGYMTTALVCL